jgi:hypothetical protein
VLGIVQLGSRHDPLGDPAPLSSQVQAREIDGRLGLAELGFRARDFALVVGRVQHDQEIAPLHPIPLVDANGQHLSGELTLELHLFARLHPARLQHVDAEGAALRRHDQRRIDRRFGPLRLGHH